MKNTIKNVFFWLAFVLGGTVFAMDSANEKNKSDISDFDRNMRNGPTGALYEKLVEALEPIVSLWQMNTPIENAIIVSPAALAALIVQLREDSIFEENLLLTAGIAGSCFLKFAILPMIAYIQNPEVLAKIIYAGVER